MSTLAQRLSKYNKRKLERNPFDMYDKNMMLKGTIDEEVRDSITGHGDAILHKASNPDEYVRVFEKLEEDARVNYRGQIAKEVAGDDGSIFAATSTIPMDLLVLKMQRPRAGNAAAINVWDKEAVPHKTQWLKKREDYFEQVDAIKGHIMTLMSKDINDDLNKIAAYRNELNNEEGSLRAYLDVLTENLSVILPWSKANNSNAVEKNIKEMKIYKCGCALVYYRRIQVLINLLKKSKTMTEKQRLQIDNIPDDDIRAQQSRLIEVSKDAEVDGEVSIIKVIYDEVVGHGMDKRGKEFYRDMFTQSQCKLDSTPFSERTVVNNEVKGGLSNMLKMFKVTLDRIKEENPTMKIHYINNNSDLGNKLKTGKDDEIKINATDLKKAKKEDIQLDPYDDVDFKNKKPDVKPCTYCRDTLVRYNICKGHSYNQCFFNPNCQSTLATRKPEVKKTAEQRQKAEDGAKAKRAYVKEKGIGRQ